MRLRPRSSDGPLWREAQKPIRRFVREHRARSGGRPDIGMPMSMLVPRGALTVKLLFGHARRSNDQGRGGYSGYVSLRLPFVPWRDRRVDLRVRRRGLLSLLLWLGGKRRIPVGDAGVDQRCFVAGDPGQARAFFEDEQLRELVVGDSLFTDLRVTTGLDATVGVVLPPTVQQFQASTTISEWEYHLIYDALCFYLRLGEALIRGLQRQELIQERDPERLIRPARL